MILRYPFLRRNVTEHATLLLIVSAHVLLDAATPSPVTASATFSAACKDPPLQGLTEGKGGACRRRGRRGRGGGRRVQRRSGGARGRGGGENHRPVFPPSGRCIPCSWRPDCGRNCALRVPAARRGPGSGPTARCCASSRSIGRARERGWTFAASRSSESPPPRG